MRQAEATRQLGISENSLSNWLKALAAGKLGQVAGVSRVSPEQIELSRLRAENARLKMELEITKKAAVDSMDHGNTIGSNEDFGGGEYGTNGTTGAVYKAEGRFVAKVERRTVIEGYWTST